MPSELTDRQRIMQAIENIPCSARDLARQLAMPERHVEEHLAHIVRSLANDKTRRLLMEPAVCEHCEFVFKSRSRLTRPSRCPRCQSERIAAPRFAIRGKDA
jgi:predicted Zn-ribbon and HTH transcriptional regulator